ncbi:type I-F CRISPR-associated protein Csy1 [Zoogloea sp.]|uniref:type I-F CRISPR-associated protein Csy1 n=1 Tax=Zoogloea sp. TaxID=49181 RepID=UPI0026198E48|nr:type I-F CRISPR-associated protein Csy1 [uncultured Zoogloea sp.]
MSDSPEDRRALFRAAIEQFLQERLASKLDKLAADDPKRSELLVQYTPAAWLADAARRVAQIQTVTHSLKPIHPEARGTNLYCPPESLPRHREVGSHVLSADFAGDVVGNAAALDVYKFLKIAMEGRPLLEWMQQGDADLLAALSNDPERAQTWAAAFRSVTEPASEIPASHALAKQLYWLTGEDPADDSDFHLLAPLYASSFAHTVFRTINEGRFSESARAAQKAKWERRDHDGVSREYPGLAVQKFGGTKPQNISQLNSERGGSNYLLASLPPRWKSREVQAPWYVDSVLSRYGRSEGAWALVRELRDFLLSDPPPTMETRNRREGLIDSLIDGLVDFAQRFQVMLPAGWTHDARCRLPEAERLWLDPGRVLADAEDDAVFCGKWHQMNWPADVGGRFGNWLNNQMGSDLPLGDVETRQWQTELLLQQDWAQRLHQLRGQLDAPRYIPTREGV